MALYSNEVNFDLFVIHGNCQKTVARTCHEFNVKYPNLPRMNKQKFSRLKNKFLRAGNIHPPRRRTKSVRESEDNQINVLGYFEAFPRSSIRAATFDLGLSYSSVQRILHDHKRHAYSFIRLQKLRPTDYPIRVNFCEDLLIYRKTPIF